MLSQPTNIFTKKLHPVCFPSRLIFSQKYSILYAFLADSYFHKNAPSCMLSQPTNIFTKKLHHVCFPSRLIFSQKSSIMYAGQSPKYASEIIYNKRSIIQQVRKLFQKTNMSYPLIHTRMCAYQGVGYVSCFLKILRTF